MLKKHYELILNQTENQVPGEDPEILAFNKDSDKSFNWLSNIGEDFLSNNKNMGTKRNQLQQFQINHQQLFEELNNINKVILHMKNTLQNYPKKKKKIVYDLIDKIETMQNKSSKLSSRIKFRLLTVKLVLSFTDHTEEVSLTTVYSEKAARSCFKDRKTSVTEFFWYNCRFYKLHTFWREVNLDESLKCSKLLPICSDYVSLFVCYTFKPSFIKTFCLLFHSSF